jgi:hypothetical protein
MCCEGNPNIRTIEKNYSNAQKNNVKINPTYLFTWIGKVNLNSLATVDNVS